MHQLLKESNSIAALPPESVTEAPHLSAGANGMDVLIGTQVIISAAPEEWMEREYVGFVKRENRSLLPMDEGEESRILSDPDVAAAIDAALPEIEAWERA
jgi:hypothetical protein